jgi:hypothetical protein
MYQIEALYIAEFGDIAGFGYRNGGVVVLETNRVFGEIVDTITSEITPFSEIALPLLSESPSTIRYG